MFPVSVYLIPAGLARRGEGKARRGEGAGGGGAGERRMGRGQHYYCISIKMPGGQRLRTADIPPGSYPGNVYPLLRVLYVAVEMTRYTVHYDRRYIALDEGAYIADEFICHISAVFCHPFTRHELFVIGDLVYVFDFGAALIRII